MTEKLNNWNCFVETVLTEFLSYKLYTVYKKGISCQEVFQRGCSDKFHAKQSPLSLRIFFQVLDLRVYCEGTPLPLFSGGFVKRFKTAFTDCISSFASGKND